MIASYFSDLSSELSHAAVIPTRTALRGVEIKDKYLVKHMALLTVNTMQVVFTCKWFCTLVQKKRFH